MSASRRKPAPLADYDDEQYTYAAFNVLRHEAMTLLDQSLANGQALSFLAFVERQIAQTPPPLELLNQLADDVHQRWQLLRQTHFDLREQMLIQLRIDYGIDLTPIAPPEALEVYHRLDPDDVLRFAVQQKRSMSPVERAAMRALLTESLASADLLHRDLTLAGDLYDHLVDWLTALHLDLLRVWQGHSLYLQ